MKMATVIVIGKLPDFNYTPQMQSAELIQVVSKGNANPLTPIQMTIEEIHAVDFKTTDLWGAYIQVEGTVVADGNYFNLQDGDLTISLYQSNTTVLAQLKDQKLFLTYGSMVSLKLMAQAYGEWYLLVTKVNIK